MSIRFHRVERHTMSGSVACHDEHAFCSSLRSFARRDRRAQLLSRVTMSIKTVYIFILTGLNPKFQVFNILINLFHQIIYILILNHPEVFDNTWIIDFHPFSSVLTFFYPIIVKHTQLSN
jgi:hypothetical protein